MNRIIAAVVFSLLAMSTPAKDAPVKGTIRKDGTYVAPHHRTTPNNTRTDNYSSKPNVNLHTGKEGRVDPNAPKPPPPSRP